MEHLGDVFTALGYGVHRNDAQEVAESLRTFYTSKGGNIREGETEGHYFTAPELPGRSYMEEIGLIGAILFETGINWDNQINVPELFARTLIEMIISANHGRRKSRIFGALAAACNSNPEVAATWVTPLSSLFFTECGVTIEVGMSLLRIARNVVVFEDTFHNAFPDGSEECTRSLTVATVNIPPNLDEWKAGLGVNEVNGMPMVKTVLINGVQVFPSEFARCLAMYLGFMSTNDDNLIRDVLQLQSLSNLKIWPLGRDVSKLGLGWHHFNPEIRRKKPDPAFGTFRVKRSMKIGTNGEFQAIQRRKWVAIATIFLGISAPGFYLIGWKDPLAGSILLAGLGVAFLSAIADNAGWPYVLITCYGNVGNGIGTVADDHSGVVAECYRNNICPYSENCCWYDGAPAGSTGLPCGGLKVKDLDDHEYYRGLLSKPGSGLFMVSDVDGQEIGHAVKRLITAWPTDPMCAFIGCPEKAGSGQESSSILQLKKSAGAMLWQMKQPCGK